jgi:23S rRNA (cytidine1920-2'-O)/16S rRNA (cytidine1409-2'-O)-methyltransferase
LNLELIIAKMKTRLDQLLVARGLARSRAQAQALIMAGRVAVEGLTSPKAGALVPEAARVTVRESGGTPVLRIFNALPGGPTVLIENCA